MGRGFAFAKGFNESGAMSPSETVNAKTAEANNGQSTELSNLPKPGPALKTAGGKTINNSKWANQLNPNAWELGFNVPVKFNGYPDFNAYLYTAGFLKPGTVVENINTVHIKMTGTYEGDFKEANRLAKLQSTPEGYTWHHTENMGELKLVNSGLPKN